MLIKLAEGVSFGTSPSVISQVEIPIDYRDHAHSASPPRRRSAALLSAEDVGERGRRRGADDPPVEPGDLRLREDRRAGGVVDYSHFAGDLAAGQHRFLWITPNLCDDAHDCTERHGDDWLRANVPPILASAAYRNGGTLFITWDEGERGSEQIVTLVLSTKLVRPGFRSDARHGHASLLSTIELLLGLPRLVTDPGSEPMTEFFR